MLDYHIDTEPLYHAFMYSLVSLHSGIYPLPAIHSLLVTIYIILSTAHVNPSVKHKKDKQNSMISYKKMLAIQCKWI